MPGRENQGTKARGPSRSAVGGSGNEAGSEYRASVAAWLVAFGLVGRGIEGVDLLGDEAIPTLVSLETDAPVDDINVALTGGKLLAQAKRSLTLGDQSFSGTVEQWKRAVREQSFDPDRDRLVLFTEADSRPLLALAQALDRGRLTNPGRSTIDQQDAMKVLTDQLGDLSATQRQNLLRTAAVLRVETLAPNAPQRVVAETLLDESVVEHGEGSAAFRALKEAAKRTAVARHGRVLEEWLDAIEEARLHLRSSLNGGPSARASAVGALIEEYCERVVRRGSSIDLMPLGISLPPIHLDPDARHWRVDTGERERDTGRDLGNAIRRRGRLVLLGGPGSGKSSALAQIAAAWALDPAQPIPIVVPLPAVLTIQGPVDLQALVRVGRDVGSNTALAEELVARLQRGGACLFLDALDECRDRRFEVVPVVRNVVADVSPATDVVLSTRDVAYAQAETLGWPSARLLIPDRMDKVLELVATQAAQSQGVLDEQRPAWTSARLERVYGLRDEFPQLRSTPLLQVLALLALATRSPEAVVAARGHLLSDLVDEAVERQELRLRQAGQFGAGHSRPEAIRLVQAAFNLVGHRLFVRGDTARVDAVGELATEISRNWNLPVASAEGMADHLLAFWDEAGVFVASGNPPTIHASIPALLELAEARHAAGHPESSEAWIKHLAEEASNREVLLLGAGLSQEIAESLVVTALELPEGPLVLIAAAAVERGATLEPELLQRLTRVLMERATSGPERADEAKALARIPVPPHLQSIALAALQGQTDEADRAMTVGLAIVRWHLPIEEHEKDLRRALVTPPPTAMFVDEAWVEAVVGATDGLLAEGLDIGTELSATYRHVSHSAERQLDAVLGRHGRLDLRPTESQEELQETLKSYSAMKRSFDRADEAWSAMISHLSSLGGTELTPEQARRLTELADLVETIEPGHIPSSWAMAAYKRPERLVELIDLAILLGGFDAQVCAAEATLVAGQMSRLDASLLLGDNADERELSRWDSVGDVEVVRRRLVELMAEGPLFALFAAEAMLHAPNPEASVSAVSSKLLFLPPESRTLGARLVLLLSPDLALRETWLANGDPVLRIEAARRTAQEWISGDVSDEALTLAMTSADAGVRAAAAREVADAGKRLPELVVHAMDREGPKNWQCKYCDRVNEAGEESCSNCRLVGNQSLAPGSSLRERVVPQRSQLPL